MHLFKQYAVEDHEAAARMIPVIDYGPYFGGEPGALDRVAAEVAHACQNVGFFYALNHGVGEEVIERAFAASRRFHALPLAQKLAVKLDDNNIGYLPINASVQGASTVHKATRPNQNESFFVSHDRGPDHPDVTAGKPLRGRNQWPAGLPGLRADMMAYFAALEAMCDRMLPPFAVALGLRPDYFAPFFANEAHANLRFLHYPPQEMIKANTFGQAPHTDNSFMTALARTDVPGLAVRLPSGEWFAPPIIPGTKRQLDSDRDGLGDACDPSGTFDDNNDGVPDDIPFFAGTINCKALPLAKFIVSTVCAPGGRAAISPNTASPSLLRYHSMCANPVSWPRALSTFSPSSLPASNPGPRVSRRVTVCGLIHSTPRPISGRGRYHDARQLPDLHRSSRSHSA